MISIADKANLGFLEDALGSLDEGRFAEAIVTFEVEGAPVSGMLGQLWRAEVALYLDRLDVAAEHIDELGRELEDFIADDGSFGTLARRKLLIEAEIAYFRGELGAARNLATKAAKFSLLADDVQNQIRAFIDLGRIARNRGEYPTALAHLATLNDVAREHGTEFAQGLVRYYEGTSLLQMGRIEDSHAVLEKALPLLRASENLRYAGMAYGMLGSSLCDLNRVDEGIAMLESAEKIAADLGIARDMMPVTNNIARAMLVIGRPAEAERRLIDLIGWERAMGDPANELGTLKLLVVAQSELRKYDEAQANTEELDRLACTHSHAGFQLDGQILMARIRSRQRQPDAVDKLRGLVKAAEGHQNKFAQAEASVYLAEALVSSSAIEAKALLQLVDSLPGSSSLGWLKPIRDRVETDLERIPIRIQGEALVIDSRLGFPTLKDAREAVERFLFDRSMAETNGNASAAGRLIGASPFQMHCLGRALQGLPTRPGRNPDPDAPPTRRRPRKLHWQS